MHRGMHRTSAFGASRAQPRGMAERRQPPTARSRASWDAHEVATQSSDGHLSHAESVTMAHGDRLPDSVRLTMPTSRPSLIMCVGVGRDRQLALADEAGDLRPRAPWRCRSEIRRCRRAYGLDTGMPAALHALMIAVRSRSAVTSKNSLADGTRSSRGGSDASSAPAARREGDSGISDRQPSTT